MHYLADPTPDESIEVITLLNFLLPEIAHFDLYCPQNPQTEGPATPSASDAGGVGAGVPVEACGQAVWP